MPRDLETVRNGYEALTSGDVPLVALLTPETVWRGVERGFLWWRRAPS